MADSSSADAATPLAAPAADPPPASFFGGAFFGLDLPPGYTRPTEAIPDLWAADLAERQADSTGLSGLHRASRGCRLWVLRHIPTLSLSLSNAAGKPWGADARILAATLAARGPRPTCAAVDYYGPQVQAAEGADHGFLEQVAEALAGEALTELRVTGKRRGAAQEQALTPYVSDFVARVASVCPRLASLTVTDTVCRLPQPTQAPHLTDVSIAGVSSPSEACITAACSTLPQLLGQLTSLHIHTSRPDIDSSVWASIFSAQAPTAHKLKHLSVDADLDDSAVSLLLAKAPSLSRLTFRYMRVSKVHTGQWAVEYLESGSIVSAYELVRLPTRASGQTELVCPWFEFFGSPEEIDESEQRLSFWLINADTVQMPDGSGPNDLLPMLPHFGRLPTCNRPELWLDEWHCTAESVQTLAPILRGLQGQYEPRIELRREITDEVVSLLLQLGSAAHSVGLPNLRLQSGLVCEAAWPWHVLRIYNHGEEMRITDLLGLPHPGQAEEPPLLCVAGHIVIPALSKGKSAALQERLSNLHWSGRGQGPFHTTLPYSGHPDALTKQIALLRCMRPHPTVGPQYLQLNLQGWPVTHAVMQALQGLEECCTLAFEQCTWPLPPTEYRALGQRAPVTASQWGFRGELPTGVLAAVCEGVHVRRAGRGLPSLALRVCDAPKTNAEWGRAGITYKEVEVFSHL